MLSVQHVEVSLSQKCFEEAVENITELEDEKMMNCLTKHHDAQFP